MLVFVILSSILLTLAISMGITFQPKGYALNQPFTETALPTTEVPTTSWEQLFGGSAVDKAPDIIEVSTGGYAISGSSNSYDGSDLDMYLIRTDNGDPATELWSHTYGSSDLDEAWAVVECNDGGFAVVGYTYGFGAGSNDIYFVRTNPSGNELFSQTYGGSDSDAGFDVVALGDGGFILVGTTMSYGNNPGEKTDIWLIRITADGTHLWDRTYGSQEMDFGFRVIEVSTGGFAILGWVMDVPTLKYQTTILRVNEAGDVQWFNNYTIGEEVVMMGQRPDFVETLDGGFAITGAYQDIPPSYLATYLIKTDASGNEQWRQIYADSGAFALVQTSDEGYTLLGAIMENNLPSAYLWSTDSLGNLRWSQRYGDELVYDIGLALIIPQAGGYTFVGAKDVSVDPAIVDLDVWLVRILSEGPKIPGFPLASILVGVIIALSFVFYIRRKQRLR